ncbi:MAG: long-chain fatty acid--CoA ligase, partial [Actinomycetota bacterium]|nr:long-chain fatty acid--CoA ligase [Actinomycetota bacterium]
MTGLADLLAARAGADPDARAFHVDGEGDLSYRSWDRRSNALARGLCELGVGAGDRVVLRFEVRHWTDYAVACAGVLKVGAVAVPVSADVTGVDGPTRGLLGLGLAGVVDHSGAAIVVARGSLSSVAEAVGAAPIATVHDLGDGQDDAALTNTAPAAGVVEISYRPGHLRPPRAVAHTEAEILRVLDAAGPGPMLHTFAIGGDPARSALWAPLGSSGVTGGDRAGVVVLAGLDPERFCELSAEQSVTRWCLVPATAALVLESGAPGRHDLSSVRRIDLVGLVGQRHPASIVARLAAVFPDADVVTVATTDEPPPRVDVGQESPVAFSQEGMLWQEQFVPGSQNLPPLVRRFRGPL